MDILETFTSLLDSDDVKTISVVLEAINNILTCGEKNFMEEVDGKQENIFVLKLENLGAI